MREIRIAYKAAEGVVEAQGRSLKWHEDMTRSEFVTGRCDCRVGAASHQYLSFCGDQFEKVAPATERAGTPTIGKPVLQFPRRGETLSIVECRVSAAARLSVNEKSGL